MPVTVGEILEATGGRLVSGPPDATFSRLRTDSREVTPGTLFVALRGEQQDGHAYIPDALERGASGVLSATPPAIASEAAVIQVADTRAALFALTRHRLETLSIPVVAITGSSGKTTTKDLIAHVLSRRLTVHKSEGNLNTYTGIPMTVFDLPPHTQVLVVEYAMSRAGEIRELTTIAPPSIGVVLNVGLAHVGRLGSIDAVAAAKRELVEGLRPDGVAILNADDPRVRAMAPVASRTVLYGLAGEAVIRAEQIRMHGLDGSAFRLVTPTGKAEVFLRIPGRHSISNALAAAGVAAEFGFEAAAIASALHGFTPPHQRLNLVPGIRGATIIDDCYNANPGSVEAALEVLRLAPPGSVRVAILGDMLELGDHADTAHAGVGRLAAASADRLIAMGEFAPTIVTAARNAGLRQEAATIASSVDDAAAQALPLLGPRTQVLVKGSRGMRMEGVVAALRRPE